MMNLNMTAAPPTATAAEQQQAQLVNVLIRKNMNNNTNGNGMQQPTTPPIAMQIPMLPMMGTMPNFYGTSGGNANAAAIEAYKRAANNVFAAPTLEIQKSQESADLSADEDGGTGPGTSEDAEFKTGRIRKRRYSMARIQPTRIKKVMQSDEEIGRMVASVPVAIGSAMELFAEKLLQGAAEAMQHSSTKTLSPVHIKCAITRNPHFSFLAPVLADVQLPTPRLGPMAAETIHYSQQQQGPSKG